jgi:predicted nucleotidyltransferase
VISSKPAEAVLDHDHLEDVDGAIYVAVGNRHLPNAAVAYLKYVPTARRTLWCRGGTCFERVVRRYGASYVLGAVRGLQEEVYDPSLGVTVPVVRFSRVRAVYRPRERLAEVLRRPRDPVELDVAEAYAVLRSCSGVSPGSVGVDGSVLVGIHNPEVSDVDLVVYGCRDSVEVATTAHQAFGRLPAEVEVRRLRAMSEVYGLPPEVLAAISPPYKRLYLAGRREVNIMFSADTPGRYGERVLVPLAVAEALIEVEGGDCRSLYYPGEARVSKTIDLRVERSLAQVAPPPGGVGLVLNYESLYSYVLFRGGTVRARGVLALDRTSETLVLVVGTREAWSYVVPKDLTEPS